MNKIIVIGCPGSGKSTFSKKLHSILKIPLYHLDMLNWNPNKTTVDKFVFIERLQEVTKKSSWIIDGNYASTIELRLIECDTVFFLDYEVDICLNGVKERKGKPRSDMPWIEDTDEEDLELIDFIKNYNTLCKPKVMELLNKYCDKKIIIFKNRRQASDYLRTLI